MIVDISQNSSVVARYKKFEVTFQLTGIYSSPFDPQDVEVWGVFIGPEHTETVVPGFQDQDFEIVKAPGAEKLKPKGRPRWKVRYAPSEVGEYRFEIKVRYQQSPPMTSSTMTFDCDAGDSKGFVRLREYTTFLRFDNDSTYLPIGHNLGWESKENRSVYSWFKARLQKMQEAKINWTRLWMTYWGWQGTAIEWSPLSYAQGYVGVGAYSLESAWKLDRVVEAMECSGIAAQLVIEPHTNWRTDTDWNTNPYNNCVDGGFLDEPGDFFSDDKARRLFMQRLRYIVARWGYSTSIMAWELFNEVQLVDGFDVHSGYVIGWHHEMADYLRAIDPAKHVVGTGKRGSSRLRMVFASILR